MSVFKNGCVCCLTGFFTKFLSFGDVELLNFVANAARPLTVADVFVLFSIIGDLLSLNICNDEIRVRKIDINRIYKKKELTFGSRLKNDF